MGLTPWNRVAIAVSMAAQAAALASVSHRLHPAWSTTLVVAAVAATLAIVRVGRVVAALAANLALTCAVFVSLGTAVGAVRWGRVAVPGWSWSNLLVAALWWWALHAPVVVARWRARSMPADAAARAVAGALGASLLGSAIALLSMGVPAWLKWASVAFAVGALAWAWRTGSGAGGPGGPPEYAVRGGSAYRRSVREEARRESLLWGRWALFVVEVGWGVALSGPGGEAVRTRRVAGQWIAVANAMRSLRVGDDPCGVGAGPDGRRELTWEDAHNDRYDAVTVRASGAIVWTHPRWGAMGSCGADVSRQRRHDA